MNQNECGRRKENEVEVRKEFYWVKMNIFYAPWMNKLATGSGDYTDFYIIIL